MLKESQPITYGMLSKTELSRKDFQRICNFNPDEPVKCNCKWDGGHEAHCDIVAAHELISKLKI